MIGNYMYVIELLLYVILGRVVFAFVIFLLIELYNVFFESLNFVKFSSFTSWIFTKP